MRTSGSGALSFASAPRTDPRLAGEPWRTLRHLQEGSALLQAEEGVERRKDSYGVGSGRNLGAAAGGTVGPGTALLCCLH